MLGSSGHGLPPYPRAEVPRGGVMVAALPSPATARSRLP
jgi:hypothetical protein